MRKRNVYFMMGVLFICIVFAGCSAKGPDSAMVKSDLTINLQSYYPFLSLESYTVEQSMTNDSYYTASASVVAHSEYAQYNLNTNISYTKYDQGWRCDYCDWAITNCVVNNWPTEAQMEDLVYERSLEVEDYLQDPAYSTLNNDGQLTLMYEGTVNSEYEDFIGINGNIVSYWNYSPEEGNFLFDKDDTEIVFSLTKNMEGTWKDLNPNHSWTSSYYVITDQEGDHFTLEVTKENIKGTVYILPQSLSEFEESHSLIFVSDELSETEMRLEISKNYDSNYRIWYHTSRNGGIASYHGCADIPS